MKFKGAWEFDGHSIPGFWIEDGHAPDGKRFEASEHGYRKLRRLHCELNHERCSNAGNRGDCRIKATWHTGELHHTGEHGRGAGGALRDDRYTVWLCRPCHEAEEKKRTGTRWLSTSQN